MGEQLRFHVDPARIDIVPGGDAVTLTVTVFNASRIIDEFAVSAIGTGQWLQGEPAQVRLFPDTEGTVELSLSIPAGTLVPAGPRTIGIQVRSTSDPANARVERVEVEVGAVAAEQTLTLEPQVVRGGDDGQLYATVRNGGNTNLSLSLRGEDPEGAVRFSFDPPALAVAPGGWGRSLVRFSAPRPNTGTGAGRQLTVHADGSGLSLSANATFVQAPRFTRGRVALLGWVLALAGAAAMVGGAFLEWVRPGLAGTEITYREYLITAFDVPPGDLLELSPSLDFFTSVGFLAIALGLVAALGLITPKRRFTRLAGGASIVALLVFAATMARVDGLGALGPGVWLVTAGSVLAVVGGYLGTTK